MPAILHYLPTPSLNEAATQILTARSTSTTSAAPDYSSPGAIAGLVWFGIIGTIVLIGFAIGCFECCECGSCTCDDDCCTVICFPIVGPFWVVKKVFEIVCKLVGKLYDLTIGPPIRRRSARKHTARMARNNRANELSRRSTARRKWAQEELQLARKERRVPNLPRSWIVELERSWKKTNKFRFEDLPAEIRLEIYSYLDYGTALKLMLVSRFFSHDRPTDGIGKEQRAAFLFHAGTFHRNNKKLACFECLMMKESGAFEEEQRTGEYERYAEREVERRCFDCQVERGEIRWPRWTRLVRSFKAKIPVNWRLKRRR